MAHPAARRLRLRPRGGPRHPLEHRHLPVRCRLRRRLAPAVRRLPRDHLRLPRESDTPSTIAPLYYGIAGGLTRLGRGLGLGEPAKLAQLWNVPMAVGTVALVIALARLLAPRRPWLAAAAAGYVALSPVFTRSCSMFNPEPTDLFVSALCLYLAARILVAGGSAPAPRWRSASRSARASSSGSSRSGRSPWWRSRSSPRSVAARRPPPAASLCPRRARGVRRRRRPLVRLSHRQLLERDLRPAHRRQAALGASPRPLLRRPGTARSLLASVSPAHGEPGGPGDVHRHVGRLVRRVRVAAQRRDAEPGDPRLARRAERDRARADASSRSWAGSCCSCARSAGAAAVAPRLATARSPASRGYLYFTVSYPVPDGDVLKPTYMLSTLGAWALCFGWAADRAASRVPRLVAFGLSALALDLRHDLPRGSSISHEVAQLGVELLARDRLEHALGDVEVRVDVLDVVVVLELRPSGAATFFASPSSSTSTVVFGSIVSSARLDREARRLDRLAHRREALRRGQRPGTSTRRASTSSAPPSAAASVSSSSSAPSAGDEDDAAPLEEPRDGARAAEVAVVLREDVAHVGRPCGCGCRSAPRRSRRRRSGRSPRRRPSRTRPRRRRRPSPSRSRGRCCPSASSRSAPSRSRSAARGCPRGRGPPSFAATMIARESFEKSLPRFASAAPFLCLIDDHLLCPDTGISSRPGPGTARGPACRRSAPDGTRRRGSGPRARAPDGRRARRAPRRPGPHPRSTARG